MLLLPQLNLPFSTNSRNRNKIFLHLVNIETEIIEYICKKIFIIKSWLMLLWKPRCPTICLLSANWRPRKAGWCNLVWVLKLWETWIRRPIKIHFAAQTIRQDGPNSCCFCLIALFRPFKNFMVATHGMGSVNCVTESKMPVSSRTDLRHT